LQASGPKFTLNCGGKLIYLDKPCTMGIINTTPDSFYSSSRVASVDQSLALADKHVKEGALFLDIGAQSTGPGSKMVGPDEEWKRMHEPLKELLQAFPNALLSIDTFYSSVARKAVELGAHLINDVSAGEVDPELPLFMADCKLPYVIMHKSGDFETMQNNPQYQNAVVDDISWFIEKVRALNNLGLSNLIIDPGFGFGFGKSLEHNYALLRNLNSFRVFNMPLLVGISRKTMIKVAANVDSENALNATTAAHILALQGGAKILRVHDVKEAEQAISIYLA